MPGYTNFEEIFKQGRMGTLPTSFGKYLEQTKMEEQSMNTYERQTISKLMTIEYGSAASTDQLIMSQAYFGVVIDKVKALGHEVPKELQEAFDSCTRDLDQKLRSERQRKLEDLKCKRDELLSADQKRENLEIEIQRLTELLK